MNRRRRLTALCAAMALLGAACGGSEEEVERARAVLAPVEEQIHELPGVVRADLDVGYVTGFEYPEVVDLEVISEGTTMAELVDHGMAAMELVWDAPLEELASLELLVRPADVDVRDPDGRRLSWRETLGPGDLEEVFGPRGGEG